MELEDALEAACNKIEFMHGCLTDPHIVGVSGGFVYAHAEMTGAFLTEAAKLIPDRPTYCLHSSGRELGCASCAYFTARAERRAELETRL